MAAASGPVSRVSTLVQEFLRFGLVGFVGFLVDAGVLWSLLRWPGLDPYSGRVVSYLVAASVTFLLHRNFTFLRARRPAMGGQWMKFILLNGVGAVLNYGVYAVLVATVPLFATSPVLGVAVGSVVAMLFSFTVNRTLVFKAG